MIILKRLARFVLDLLVRATEKTALGERFQDRVVTRAMMKTSPVRHGDLALEFAVPSRLSRWRVATFSTKEPETLEWIDAIPKESVVWDIGANIGLYSVYAAKQRHCKVLAFEPSVFNLELLARNISLNHVADRICIVPLALTKRMGPNQMHISTTDWGGALSTFGNNLGWDGQPIREVFAFQTIGLSISDCVDALQFPMPDFIKMDVDGIEHIILEGGSRILSNVRGILIEVNDDFREQAEQCEYYLRNAGLVLKEKRQLAMSVKSASPHANTFNQIWTRR